MALGWALADARWLGEPGADASGRRLPEAWREASARAEAAGLDALASFCRGVAQGLGASSPVPLRETLASALAGGGRLADLGRIAHLAVARSALAAVRAAARRGRDEAAASILVRSLGLDCPRALEAALQETDPAARAATLAAARCLPLCPAAVDALALAPPEAAAELDPGRCPPASLGVRSAFERDTAALNLRAWSVLRTLEALQGAVEALGRSSRPAARAATEGGLGGGVRAVLERLSLRVTPPPRLPLGPGQWLRLPRDGEERGGAPEPWPALFAVWDGQALRVGALPRARGWADARGRLLGTPWPGRPLGEREPEATVAAARAEADPRADERAVLLFVGEEVPEQVLQELAARLVRLELRRVERAAWDEAAARVVRRPLDGVDPSAQPAAAPAASGSPTGSGGP